MWKDLVIVAGVLGWATATLAEAPVPPSIDALITQLGGPSFQERERAARELVEIGSPALEALKKASAAENLEIRYRARRVLERVNEDEHERRLQAFLDSEGQEATDLPGWDRYSESVGDDEAARELFAEMQRAEWRLFAAIARGDDVEQAYAQRCIEVQYRYTYGGTKRVPMGTLAALLFLAGDESLEIDSTAQSRVGNLCNYNDFRQQLMSGPRRELARNVLASWLVRDDEANANTLFTRTRVAMQYDIPQGLVPAKRLLAENLADYRAQYGLLAIGKFGDAAELATVEKLFDNETVLSSSNVKNKVRYTCQVRDVALAVALHMTDQKTSDYPFARLRKQGSYLYSPNTAGFDDDAKRTAAFAKYAAWQASPQEGSVESATPDAATKPEPGVTQPADTETVSPVKP